MTKLAFQPANDAMAERMLERTLEHPVMLSELKALEGTRELDELTFLYPGQMARLFGVRPGRSDAQKKQWAKLERGDVVLFMRNNLVFLSAVVTHTLQSARLARELWGPARGGEPAECIYFLDEVKDQRIPRAAVNQLCGHKREYDWRGFTVKDEKRSTELIRGFELESEIHYPDVTVDEYREIVARIDPTRILDARGRSRLRKEDGFLRDYHFGNKVVAECGICGRTLPTQFLIAAHIKDRWHCTKVERMDYENIAMPMCKFGCEQLYRRNYITVIDERVAVTKAKVASNDLKAYLVKVRGRVCPYWRGSEAYFNWHTRFGSY